MSKPIVVFLMGLVFLLAGVGFFSSASDLSHVGPITFDSNPAQANNAVAIAAASGFKSFIADKLCLVGEILIGIGALGWI